METVATTERRCAECNEVKPVSGFYFNRHRGIYFKRCKPCERARSTARYHAANPTARHALDRELSRRQQLTTAPDVTSPNTTRKGLGWQHQLQRARLVERHVDGSPCYWCGRGLHLNPDLNWDGNSLEADHSIPRSQGGTIADRLLHRHCNRARGDGDRDHLRPALTMHP